MLISQFVCFHHQIISESYTQAFFIKLLLLMQQTSQVLVNLLKLNLRVEFMANDQVILFMCFYLEIAKLSRLRMSLTTLNSIKELLINLSLKMIFKEILCFPILSFFIQLKDYSCSQLFSFCNDWTSNLLFLKHHPVSRIPVFLFWQSLLF